MNESLREAVRRYVEAGILADSEWQSILQRTRKSGRVLGVESEVDVELLSDEFREERRRAS